VIDSPQRQARLLRVGAIITPVLAVGLIRFAGPQQSLGAVATESQLAPALPDYRSSATPDGGPLATAAGYAQRLYEAGINGTPFPKPQTYAEGSDTPPDPATQGPSAPASSEPPEIRVSAIMSRRGGAIAVIDSRVCAPGSVVSPGWTLAKINENDRTLTLRHTSGRLVEMTLSQP